MKFDMITFWITLGLALIILEMLSTSFYLLFIGIGCFAAALTATQIDLPVAQVLIAILVSLLGVLIFREKLRTQLLKSLNVNSDKGKELAVDIFIAPQGKARISYQGSTWQAINLDVEPLDPGSRAVIVGVEGNVLLLRKQF